MIGMKIKIAFAFAIIACSLTTLSALAGHARAETILYRVSVSLILFGLAGYFITNVIQQRIEQKFAALEQQEQKDDLSQPSLHDEISSDEQEDIPFDPLIPKNLEHISSVKQ